MKTIFWTLDRSLVPEQYSADEVHGLVRRCCEEWERAVGRDVLRFEFVMQEANLILAFSEHDEWPKKIARCHNCTGASIIFFDPRAKWEISRWQRFIGRMGGESFIALCLHEIGHALGCAHSPDPASIMYHAPRGSRVNANVAAFVRAKLEGVASRL